MTLHKEGLSPYICERICERKICKIREKSAFDTNKRICANIKSARRFLWAVRGFFEDVHERKSDFVCSSNFLASHCAANDKKPLTDWEKRDWLENVKISH